MAAGAQAVHRHAADAVGQPGQQRSHAGHVAVVLAGLVGAAEVHLFYFVGVNARAGDDLFDDQGGQVIGPHVG